uniref:AIG1-type G domain-containing protein n=1 Tax=Tetraodon nigroviridis TaxID=99883 RepID=H3C240_TETNG
MKIVLLGGRNSGKSSLGNLILGKEEFVTRERTSCSRRVGVVSGRRLTVVDTPGWWCDFSSRDTSELVKREIRSSVSLCPPGPHAFLVTVKTVRVDRAFTETYGRAVQEHVQLMGPLVWDRVIVLFTLGDWLGGTTIERCVESEGPPLKGLLERCGNRYHVVNNRSRGDGFQVRELIRKMEEMLAGSADGPHFETSAGHGDWLGPTSVERRVESEGEALRRLLEKSSWAPFSWEKNSKRGK